MVVKSLGPATKCGGKYPAHMYTALLEIFTVGFRGVFLSVRVNAPCSKAKKAFFQILSYSHSKL